MAFHHVAIATSNLDAAHRFYTEAMGFPAGPRCERSRYADGRL
jgi:catechol 2,3-dioxygenase-like lactoylglutathione lyase family enzyme